MSYCRFGDSDVYMFPTVYGIVCCSCSLNPDGNECVFPNSLEALKHLRRHRRILGHRVPDHAFERLKNEVREFVGVEKGGGVL